MLIFVLSKHHVPQYLQCFHCVENLYCNNFVATRIIADEVDLSGVSRVNIATNANPCHNYWI